MNGRGLGWLLGMAIYLAVCVACLIFISTPLSLVGAGLGLAGGLGVVLVLAGTVLLGGPAAAVLRTPDQVRDGELPGRVDPAFVRRDRAWPQYFAAQVLLDFQAIAGRSRRVHERMWAGPVPWVREHGLTVWWPLVVPVVAGQAAVTFGVAVGVLAALLLMAGVAGMAWLVGVPVVYLLRGADTGWQKVRRARASCPRCFELAAVPAYRCLGHHPPADRLSGDDLHRDVRPGRLGLLWRRCACGSRLPTMVLRAAFSARMQACCPSCGEALLPGAGVVTDVRMPVFGAASAGKTQLIMAALTGLPPAAKAAGIEVSFPDEHGRQAYERYADLMRRGADAAKTDASGPPVAVTVRLDKGSRSALLHVFDAAGESLIDPEQNARLSYLDYARSLVFVIDPFSIRRIADEFAAAAPDIFAAANPALHDPEHSYNVTVQRLQDYGVRTDRQRLAFVVSKADLLARLPAGPDHGDIRGWLSGLGLNNLVVAAERDFGEVAFFLTSGRDAGPRGAFAPLSWVLSKEWISVD